MTRIPTFLLQNTWLWENQYFSPWQDFLFWITEFTFHLMIRKTWCTRRKEWVCAVCVPSSCIDEASEIYSLRKLRERSCSHGFLTLEVFIVSSVLEILLTPNSTVGISIMDFHEEKWFWNSFCFHISNTGKQVWLHVFQQEVYNSSVLIFL